MSNEEGIIEIEVGLQARTKAEIDEYLAKTDSIKKVLEDVRQLEDKEGISEESTTTQSSKKGKTQQTQLTKTQQEIEKVKEEINEIKTRLLKGVDPKDENIILEKLEKRRKKLLEKEEKEEKSDVIEALESFSESDVKKLQSFLRNPQSLAAGGIERLLAKLGPNSAAILGIAGAVIVSPIFFIELMKALSVKGAAFNRDYRRFIAEEIDVGLSRELVKMRELGDPGAQVILSGGRGWTPNNEVWIYNSYYQVNETRIARIGLDDRAAGVRVS